MAAVHFITIACEPNTTRKATFLRYLRTLGLKVLERFCKCTNRPLFSTVDSNYFGSYMEIISQSSSAVFGINIISELLFLQK